MVTISNHVKDHLQYHHIYHQHSSKLHHNCQHLEIEGLRQQAHRSHHRHVQHHQ